MINRQNNKKEKKNIFEIQTKEGETLNDNNDSQTYINIKLKLVFQHYIILYFQKKKIKVEKIHLF